MLGDYLTFNGKQFPNPLPPTMTSKTLENVVTSEAGTDLVCVIRPSKKVWSLSFQLTYWTKEVLRELCEDEYTTMVYMGKTYKVRIRDFQESLVEGSEWLSSVDGLYKCSVKVTEF